MLYPEKWDTINHSAADLTAAIDKLEYISVMTRLVCARVASHPSPQLLHVRVLVSLLVSYGSRLSQVTSSWSEPEDHPFIPLLEPFERTLAASPSSSPHLGRGGELSALDLLAGSTMHALRELDELLSPVPLSWENALPNLSAWLDHSILPRIASVTTAGRRYQLLMNVGLTAKMPALAERIPPAIAADLEATREMARASVSTVLPF